VMYFDMINRTIEMISNIRTPTKPKKNNINRNNVLPCLNAC
jgi:hypothetical protein